MFAAANACPELGSGHSGLTEDSVGRTSRVQGAGLPIGDPPMLKKRMGAQNAKAPWLVPMLLVNGRCSDPMSAEGGEGLQFQFLCRILLEPTPS